MTDSEDTEAPVPDQNRPWPGTPEEVEEAWSDIYEFSDWIGKRSGDVREFWLSEGSFLRGDDEAMKSDAVSNASRMAMIVATDHLNVLAWIARSSADTDAAPLAAMSTLARGVIENAAIGYWVIEPLDRTSRIERAIRLMYQNDFDFRQAHPKAPGTLSETRRRLEALAVSCGVEKSRVVKRPVTTKILENIERAEEDLPVLGAWRESSGFAHGRPWAYVVGASVEVDPERNARTFRQSRQRVVNPAYVGMLMFKRLVAMYDHRRTAKPHRVSMMYMPGVGMIPRVTPQ